MAVGMDAAGHAGILLLADLCHRRGRCKNLCKSLCAPLRLARPPGSLCVKNLKAVQIIAGKYVRPLQLPPK